MLKGKINLKECSYNLILKIAVERNNRTFSTAPEYHYKEEHIEEAIKENIKHNLNYDTKTGKIFYGSDLRGYPSNKKDIEKYATFKEVIKWQFLNWIMNSANRIKNGYKAVS